MSTNGTQSASIPLVCGLMFALAAMVGPIGPISPIGPIGRIGQIGQIGPISVSEPNSKFGRLVRACFVSLLPCLAALANYLISLASMSAIWRFVNSSVRNQS